MSNPQLRNILQGWHRSFQKNVPFFAFFSILFERTYCSFHFFTFFLKKRSIFSVFLRSFQKNVPFFFDIYIYIYLYIFLYISQKKNVTFSNSFAKEQNVTFFAFFSVLKRERYVLFHSFLEFLATYETQKYVTFFSILFSKEWERT